jgi:NTP pyrophosphatase (non-canonical NTP hydrolase)
MVKYGIHKSDIHTPEGQKQIREFAGYVVEELMEAMNCLRNKPWVHTQTKTDREHFEEELADALHFFVELLLICGLDAEEVHDLYFRKNSVNKFRIETKY